MTVRDDFSSSDDYEEIQDEQLSGGIDDDAVDPYRWGIEDDDGGTQTDFDCECCDDCEQMGYSKSECQCDKCESCGECENSCEVGFCEECKYHFDECECDNYCECCGICEANDWRESECECAQCQTCLACENTCVEPKCAICFSHVLYGVCENCRVTNRLNDSNQQAVASKKLPMTPKRAFRSWSKSEKSIMRSLFSSGMPLAQIAKHLDRTENAVVIQLANLGLLSDVDLSNAVHQAQLRYSRATKPNPETPF